MTSNWQELRKSILDVPVGPSLRLFLGFPKPKDDTGPQRPPQEKYDLLEKYFMHMLATGTTPPKKQITDIICELSAMRCHKSVVYVEQNLGEFLDTENLDVLLSVGVSFFTISDYNSARYYFTKAITVDGQNVPALTNLGLSLRLSGNTDEAVEFIGESLRYNQDFGKNSGFVTRSFMRMTGWASSKHS